MEKRGHEKKGGVGGWVGCMPPLAPRRGGGGASAHAWEGVGTGAKAVLRGVLSASSAGRLGERSGSGEHECSWVERSPWEKTGPVQGRDAFPGRRRRQRGLPSNRCVAWETNQRRPAAGRGGNERLGDAVGGASVQCMACGNSLGNKSPVRREGRPRGGAALLGLHSAAAERREEGRRAGGPRAARRRGSGKKVEKIGAGRGGGSAGRVKTCVGSNCWEKAVWLHAGGVT